MNITLKKIIASLFCFAILVTSGAAHAQKKRNGGDFFGNEAKGKWIIGVKGAKVNSNHEDVQDADGIGIVLGYEFDRPIGDKGGRSSIELEYIDADETDLFGVGTYDPDMVNLFFTYRSAGKLYYKVKLGMSYSDVGIDLPGFNGDSGDVALAGGVGIGYKIQDYGSVELEYSADSGYNDLGLLGLNALLEF